LRTVSSAAQGSSAVDYREIGYPTTRREKLSRLSRQKSKSLKEATIGDVRHLGGRVSVQKSGMLLLKNGGIRKENGRNAIDQSILSAFFGGGCLL
jgi:hypothetical protein